jgi:hypothetical protein
MRGKGTAKSFRGSREISGNLTLDAALWQLADVLAEIARTSRADDLPERGAPEAVQKVKRPRITPN